MKKIFLEHNTDWLFAQRSGYKAIHCIGTFFDDDPSKKKELIQARKIIYDFLKNNNIQLYMDRANVFFNATEEQELLYYLII